MIVTRRQFTRMAAASAAYRLVAAPKTEDRPIGYCMVGLGRISMEHFMPATKTCKLSRVTALVSGHRDKAQRMAAEYSIPERSIYSYQNYDAIAGNKEIDAVYIALPNSMHAEYTIRAARAGKHVLCEKPMATNVRDAQAMVEACRKAGRKLMIAYRCQLEPSNLRAMELIRSGKLGKLEAIESANGFNLARGEWRSRRALAGGGPLMDMGIYSLNACRYLTGEEPAELRGYASVVDHDGRFQDVEENLSWSMRFPSGVVASCSTTYGSSMPGFYRVHGSQGWLQLDEAFSYQGQHLTAYLQGQRAIDEPNPARDPSQFAAEAEHFSGCILNNREPKTPGEEGLRDMKLMRELYRTAGLDLLS